MGMGWWWYHCLDLGHRSYLVPCQTSVMAEIQERVATLEATTTAIVKTLDNAVADMREHFRDCRADLEVRKRERHELRDDIMKSIVGIHDQIELLKMSRNAWRERILIGVIGAMFVMMLGLLATVFGLISVPITALTMVPFSSPIAPGGLQ